MTARRCLTLLGVAFALVSGAVATAEAAPQPRSEVALSATSWGYVDAATPKTAYYQPDGNLPMGTCCADGSHLTRSYVTFDLTAIRDVPFTNVLMSAGEVHFNDCDGRAIEVWRTSAYTRRSTWRNRPVERTRVATAGPITSCLDNDATFDVTAAVRDALRKHDRHLTLGFRVAEAHERDMAFYRLVELAQLRVVNNAPPATPTELRTNDEPCAAAGSGPYASSQLALSARISDPDGDQVYGEFAWWPLADPSQRRTGFGWGDPYTAYPNTWDLADGTYAWEVRAQDSWGATSATVGPCRFTVDRTDPNAPAVVSATYPESAEGGGVGMPGEFTFSPNGSTDVVKYDYDFGGGTGTHEIAAGADGTATVSFTPESGSWHSVIVRAWDRAGNLSLSTYYSFIVRETRD